MTIDPYKRGLLYRKAHGNSLRERYKEKLRFMLGVDPEERYFLSLAETDDVINSYKNWKNIFGRCRIYVLDECLKHFLSKAVGGDYYLLMDEGWRYCGAYSKVTMKISLSFVSVNTR
uniref:Uncharacterized protein n=1 Tax=Pseudomonas graminis TaxID=158627 RepID=A0A7C1WTL2_9PSED